MRAFFAINIPDKTKAAVSEIQSHLKNTCPPHTLRWVKPQSFHITLQFIQDLELATLASLLEKVREVLKPIPPFHLTLGPLELFPTLRRPKLISLATEPHDLLASLSDAIGEAMECSEISVQARPFRGHLTLGHFTFNTKKHPFILPEIALLPQPMMEVNEIILFHSQPNNDGSRYHPLEVIQLIQ
ncbi:MAG: RNA 2',3'-cyclic phosphodiesterase [Gammaproteobacteria bacterium]|nr:RNA 2',3'-cyclic phosphodiesterase [Gammaproteobacteria bacterium]